MVRTGAAVVTDEGPVPFVRLVHPTSLCFAEVSLYGATVYNWEVLRCKLVFLAQAVDPSTKEPVQGGIPVCWPQWGKQGDLAEHGFAARMMWTVESTTDSPDPSVTFLLKSSEETKTTYNFPHDFELRHTIVLGDETLSCSLAVKNLGESPLPFTGGHHSYWQVPGIDESRASGLGKLQYVDLYEGGSKKTEENEVLNMSQYPMSRVYKREGPKTIMLSPASASASMVLYLDQENYPETAVFNCHKHPDHPHLSADFKSFISIQPVAATETISLKTGEEWTATMKCNGQKFDLSEEEDKPPGD